MTRVAQPVRIHTAGKEDMLKIGQFRYQVYVNELSRASVFADHDQKTLIEPSDNSPNSVVFYTQEDGQVTGTVRVTLGPFEPGELQPYTQMVEAPALRPLSRHQIVLVSRLMVASGVRGMGEGVALVKKSFEFSCQNGVVLGLVSCKPSVEPFFSRYGFAPCGPDYLHQDAGVQRPMAMVVEPKYLSARRSRFASLCSQYKDNSPWTSIVENVFKERLAGVCERSHA